MCIWNHKWKEGKPLYSVHSLMEGQKSDLDSVPGDGLSICPWLHKNGIGMQGSTDFGLHILACGTRAHNSQKQAINRQVDLATQI